jgi:hypothetical protein
MKKNFKNALVLDPDDYNPNDYEINQKIKYKDNDIYLDAIITDIDYVNGNVAVEFYLDDDDIPDDNSKIQF